MKGEEAGEMPSLGEDEDGDNEEVGDEGDEEDKGRKLPFYNRLNRYN